MTRRARCNRLEETNVMKPNARASALNTTMGPSLYFQGPESNGFEWFLRGKKHEDQKLRTRDTIFTTVGHESTSFHQIRLNQFAVGVLDETSCFEETCAGARSIIRSARRRVSTGQFAKPLRKQIQTRPCKGPCRSKVSSTSNTNNNEEECRTASAAHGQIRR